MDIALSEEQKLFVKYALAGHNVLVDACIGSGKTTAIQALCNYLPKKQILYLTYNKLLKIDAKGKIRNPYVTVTNYHGFAWSELRRHNVSSGLSELLATYNRKKPKPLPYDLLILDEYQDITQEIADLLSHLKASLPNLQIVAVGDMEQKIYDWTRLDVRTFIQDLLAPVIPMEFTKCFRLSESFAEMLGRVWKKTIVGVNPDFKIETMPAYEVASFVAEKSPGDLLVLGARGGKMNELQNRLESKYPNKFNKKTLWSKIRESDGATSPQDGCAIFTTFDGCKGMERDVCVLYDWTKSYWEIRNHKADTQYEILRNIFLVAASRAKKILVLVDNGELLTEKDLKESKKNALPRGDLPMSELFDYKFAEDVEEAYGALEVETLIPEREALSVPLNDELIDLSPCIGHYQEAKFFTGYRLDEEIEFQLERKDRSYMRKSYQKYTLDQKLLYLAALETGQQRYMNQVITLPISDKNREAIEKRLAEHFVPEETVQKGCSIDFFDKHDCTLFTTNGIADVIKDDIVWELKFVSALSHTHALQCAMYLVALGLPEGRLYNTRTGELLKIQVPDIQKFLDKVVQCVTKGAVRKANVTLYQKRRTKEERFKTAKAAATASDVKSDADRFSEFFWAHPMICREIYEANKDRTWTPNEIRAAFEMEKLSLPVSPGMFMLYTKSLQNLE